ncbi:MAG: hypothetical protein HFJ87_02950 [Muribaculaceae bacterium]|nr:hypothetical protein [Muribaculaceae bacterium]
MSAALLSAASLADADDSLAPAMTLSGIMVFAAGRLPDFAVQHLEKYVMLLLWNVITFRACAISAFSRR